jgi:hypothetical protein
MDQARAEQFRAAIERYMLATGRTGAAPVTLRELDGKFTVLLERGQVGLDLDVKVVRLHPEWPQGGAGEARTTLGYCAWHMEPEELNDPSCFVRVNDAVTSLFPTALAELEQWLTNSLRRNAFEVLMGDLFPNPPPHDDFIDF